AEMCLDCGAEVGALEEVAMRTGEGVLNQRLRPLGLSNSSLELTKLGFDKAGPGPALPGPRRDERTDLWGGEPAVLAAVDPRHALDAGGAVVPSPPGTPRR